MEIPITKPNCLLIMEMLLPIGRQAKFLLPKIGLQLCAIKISALPILIAILTFHNEIP